MQQVSKDQDLVWASIAIAVLAGIGLVWWFSGAVGLDMATSAAVLWRLLVLAITTGSLFYFGQTMELLHPSRTWPVLLAAGWGCCWPALDYYATLDESVALTAGLQPWWDAWHTKVGGTLAIVGTGVGLRLGLGRLR